MLIDLLSLVEAAGRLPDYNLESWQPQKRGTIDICIRADGGWWHDGEPIKRHKLVQLFSRLLSYRNGQYCLLTPVEQLAIKVEKLPFVVQSAEEVNGVWRLTTNVGDQVELTERQQLMVNMSIVGDIPTVLVRDQLWASISRHAYYDMAVTVDVIEQEGRSIAQLQSGNCAYDFGILE